VPRLRPSTTPVYQLNSSSPGAYPTATAA
jgi:hypothetical protein